MVLRERLNEITRLCRDPGAKTESLTAGSGARERAAINDFARKSAAVLEVFLRALNNRH